MPMDNRFLVPRRKVDGFAIIYLLTEEDEYLLTEGDLYLIL